jgi:hypothetical protein
VRALGDRIGYGALMSSASASWREKLAKEGIAGGEFVSGPCHGTVVHTLSIIRDALALAANAAPAQTQGQPSEEALRELMQCGVAWRDTGLVLDGLRRAYAVDGIDSITPAKGAEGLSQLEKCTLNALVDVASAAFDAMDNGEETGDGVNLDPAFATKLSAALDSLENLPDDRPGYVMGPAAKAQWALRRFGFCAAAPSHEGGDHD